MSSDRVRLLELWAVLALTMACVLYTGQVLAAPTAKLTPVGDGLELEVPGANGAMVKETIPVYHAGTIRYFSTGVGLEERSAHYPPFTLKVILVAGAKAYLSQVSVSIAESTGQVLLEMPGEKVTGPWLFVDFPPGSYEITATRNQTKVKTRATITTGHIQTVYMRWKEGG